MRQSSSFEQYLRTGRIRRASASPTEFKFNPWHDPEDGRFTFAEQGGYFGGGSSSARTRGERRGRASSNRQSRSETDRGSSSYEQYDPRNPRNYSIHIVQRGETLTSIAIKRRGLRVADLASLNGISPDQPLAIGQPLKLPNQSYLEAGRSARNKFLALSHFVETHGGHLPPNVAKPPSIEDQIEAEGVRTITANGYAFDLDVLDRPRQIGAEIRLQTAPRSRRSQADAGKPDRRTTDDGGHYIAARFNGPRDWFNHFAQDANFNRGAYRLLEDEWAKAVRAGSRVFVDIVPQYQASSKRPYMLRVTYFIDGRKRVRNFPNEKQGR